MRLNWGILNICLFVFCEIREVNLTFWHTVKHASWHFEPWCWRLFFFSFGKKPEALLLIYQYHNAQPHLPSVILLFFLSWTFTFKAPVSRWIILVITIQEPFENPFVGHHTLCPDYATALVTGFHCVPESFLPSLLGCFLWIISSWALTWSSTRKLPTYSSYS